MSEANRVVPVDGDVAQRSGSRATSNRKRDWKSQQEAQRIVEENTKKQKPKKGV